MEPEDVAQLIAEDPDIMEAAVDLSVVQDMLDTGMSLRKIAAELGVNYSTLYRHAKQANLRMRSYSVGGIDEIYDLIRSGKTVVEVASQFGVTPWAIYRRLKKHGMPDDVAQALKASTMVTRKRIAQKVAKDPEAKAKRIKSIKKLWKDPEYRAKMQAVIAKSRQNPEAIKRWSEKATKRWADPKFRAKVEKTFTSPAFKARIGELSKERWEDPDYREKMTSLLHKYREKRWEETDFWDWIRTFEPSKRAEIINALVLKGQEPGPKEKRMLHHMHRKAGVFEDVNNIALMITEDPDVWNQKK